jgi:hypothetical protein
MNVKDSLRRASHPRGGCEVMKETRRSEGGFAAGAKPGVWGEGERSEQLPPSFRRALFAAALAGLLGACASSSTKQAETTPGASSPITEQVKCSGDTVCAKRQECGGGDQTCADADPCEGKGWMYTTAEECEVIGCSVL